MSIEQALERIANAVEAIVDNMNNPGGEPSAPPSKKPAKKKTPGARKKDGTRVTTVAEGVKSKKSDFKEDADKANAAMAEGDGEPWCSEEELREKVRLYAQKFGGEEAIKLIVKYGANKDKPLIAEVKNAHYKAICDEIDSHMA